MFYELEVKGHIRVNPKLFGIDVEKAVLGSLEEQFEGFISKDLGFVIAVTGITDIADGIIIPGDGAPYYDTTFNVLTFIPEQQEIVLGKIAEITDFGAFLDVGAVDGMIHVSQTMDDFVSFSKSNVLTGKESKRNLKVNDVCRARIVAVSFREPTNPKIGMTMRQPRLGCIKWVEEDLKKEKKAVKKVKK